MNKLQKADYRVVRADASTVNWYVERYHYLHRAVPISAGFALLENSTDAIKGVISFGQPASNSVKVGLFGREEAQNVIELNRLWVEDKMPKNSASFLIAHSIRQIPWEIVVSFADTNVGHIGYVYQATNWLYYGLSDKHVRWLVEGESAKHSRHMFDQYGGINKARAILGDRMVRTQRPRKHRYLYLNCDKRRRKELLSKFRYEFLPYPKPEKHVIIIRGTSGFPIAMEVR